MRAQRFWDVRLSGLTELLPLVIFGLWSLLQGLPEANSSVLRGLPDGKLPFTQVGGRSMSNFPFLYGAVDEPPTPFQQEAKRLTKERQGRKEPLMKEPAFHMPNSQPLA